jgi:phosphoribosylcarboxyaminoimidazole (NCAIR) mutase
MRSIGIMIGSDSDLSQCYEGLNYLKEAEQRGIVEVVTIITNSIHRNTEETLKNVLIYSAKVDVWIVGAGWANHLTGMVDSYLRYSMKNDRVRVIGVAFDSGDEEKNLAAFLSIEHVPGIQADFDRQSCFGSNGFLFACRFAAEGVFLDKIVLKDPKPVVVRTLDQSLIDSQPVKGGN